MSDEKMPPESERTHFRKEANKIFLFPTRLCFEKAPVDTGTAVSCSNIFFDLPRLVTILSALSVIRQKLKSVNNLCSKVCPFIF